MKNVTLSIPDDIYRAARIVAAERGTSVSALVAGQLRELGLREQNFIRLRERQKELQARVQSFTASDRLGREELHERAVRR